VALSLAHFDFARRFGWSRELKRISLLTRQIFWVHTAFLMLVLAGFGGVSLLCADDLLAPSTLSRTILGGLSVFWMARLYCQFFVYRTEHWRGNNLNTVAHVLFSLLWTFLSMVYITALCKLL